MSYYILPKINNQVLLCPSTSYENELKPYSSYSLLYYIKTIKQQIDNIILNSNNVSYNEIAKIINPCEYIFSKIPGSKYSVSKLKPKSNIFYDFLEICSLLNLFDLYTSSIVSLHICESINDTVECFEMLRENYNDTIISYNSFNNETIKDINNNDNKYDFLVFEQNFTSINEYFIYFANCLLTIFKCQKENGSCIIKIDNTCYKPTIDVIYILSSLYDKVYMLKPQSSDVTTFEKYIICKNFQNKTIFSKNYNIIYNLMQTLENKIICSFLDFETPYYFLSKIDDINIIIGNSQIESLNSICNLLKNKNREEKIEAFKKINIIKSITWCEKHKIPYNKFTEKINIFLPLNKEKEEKEEKEE